MQPNNNRGLIVTMIIIGIIIIILLLRPGYGLNRAYSYGNTNMYAASAVPFNNYQYSNYQYAPIAPAVGSYSIVRTYPTQKSYTYTTAPTYYTYPQTYPTYPGETVFSDGCTLTSPYSTTTGAPCS